MANHIRRVWADELSTFDLDTEIARAKHDFWNNPFISRDLVSSSWFRRLSDEKALQITEAIESQRQLERTCRDLEGIIQRLPEGDVAKETLQATIASTEASIAAIGDFFRAFAHHTMFTELHSTCPTVTAHQVFDIPEILEHILGFLDLPNLLTALRVSKQFLNCSKRSVKLQRQLHLLADDDCSFRLAFSAYPYAPGYHSEIVRSYASSVVVWPQDDGSSPDVKDTDVRFTFKPTSAGKLPVIGARFRSMLVSQPPIKKMKILPGCCRPAYSRLGRFRNGFAPPYHFGGHAVAEVLDAAELVNDKGITIGQLRDAAESVLLEHKLCADAEISALKDDGFVYASTAFETTIALKEDDPIVVKEVECRKKEETDIEKHTRHIALMNNYRTAKRDGEFSPKAFLQTWINR